MIDGQYIEHRDDVQWFEAEPHLRLWQRHRWQTRGLSGLDFIERCSCGAMRREGKGRWWRP